MPRWRSKRSCKCVPPCARVSTRVCTPVLAMLYERNGSHTRVCRLVRVAELTHLRTHTFRRSHRLPGPARREDLGQGHQGPDPGFSTPSSRKRSRGSSEAWLTPGRRRAGKTNPEHLGGPKTHKGGAPHGPGCTDARTRRPRSPASRSPSSSLPPAGPPPRCPTDAGGPRQPATRGPPPRGGFSPTHGPARPAETQRANPERGTPDPSPVRSSQTRHGHGHESKRDRDTGPSQRGQRSVTLSAGRDLEPRETSSLRCRQQDPSTAVSQLPQRRRGHRDVGRRETWPSLPLSCKARATPT